MSMFSISSFLEWVGLEGHTAINIYQNPTVTERSVLNTKYQAISLQTLVILFLILIFHELFKFSNLFWILTRMTITFRIKGASSIDDTVAPNYSAEVII